MVFPNFPCILLRLFWINCIILKSCRRTGIREDIFRDEAMESPFTGCARSGVGKDTGLAPIYGLCPQWISVRQPPDTLDRDFLLVLVDLIDSLDVILYVHLFLDPMVISRSTCCSSVSFSKSPSNQTSLLLSFYTSLNFLSRVFFSL